MISHSPYDFITWKTGEKYLSQYDLPDSRLFFNTGFFGAGKTQSIINHIKKKHVRVIFVHPTRSLIADVVSRLENEGIEIKSHLDLIKEGILDSWEGNIDTTLETLSGMECIPVENVLYIFDEYSTILSQIFASINDKRRSRIFETLRFIFQNCKVAFFDSLLMEYEIDFTRELSGLPLNKENFDIISNEYYIPPKRPISICYSQGYFENLILKHIEKGKKILLLTDNVSFTNSMFSALRERFPEKILYSLESETRGDILNNRTINEFIRKNKPDILSISPTGFTGLDISIDHFEEIFIFSDNLGIGNYRLYIQAIHRNRFYTKPLFIFSRNYEFDPTMKTDSLEILSDYDKRLNGMNLLAKEVRGEKGYWKTKKEHRPFEILLAEKIAYENQNKKKGLSNYICEFYGKYINEETGKPVFFIKHIREEIEKVPKEKSEKINEKRDRLKSIELIGKPDYDKLIRERAFRDLTKEETEKVFKYEISRELGIAHTDLNRENLMNEVFDFSINENKILGFAEKVNSLKEENETIYRKEEEKYNKSGFDFKPSSLALEQKIFKDFLEKYSEKEFSKNDFNTDFLRKLDLVTRRDSGELFREQIISRKSFHALYKKIGLESLVLDYAYAISRGDESLIRELYSEEILAIAESEFQKMDKKILKIKSVKKETRQKQFDRIQKNTTESINKRVNQFIRKIKSDFTVSPIDILSDWLSTWGIKLDKAKKVNNERFYKMNLSLFSKFANFNGTKNETSLSLENSMPSKNEKSIFPEFI